MEEDGKGKFLEVICPRCQNSQVVYGKSAMDIKCPSCNRLLTRTSGGKTRVRAQVKEVKNGN